MRHSKKSTREQLMTVIGGAKLLREEQVRGEFRVTFIEGSGWAVRQGEGEWREGLTAHEVYGLLVAADVIEESRAA